MRDALIILRLSALRHWRREWKQQLALLAILALGTAVYVAVRLANQSALAGFAQFTASISREPDITLQNVAGSIEVGALAEMRKALGERPALILPVAETTVTKHDQDLTIGRQEVLRLIGVDLIALQNMEQTSNLPTTISSQDADGVIVSDEMVLQSKEALTVVIRDEVRRLTINAVVKAPPGEPGIPADVLLMDLPAHQKLTGRLGVIDRVELFVPNGAAFPGLVDEIKKILVHLSKGRWQLMESEDRRLLASEMTSAFRLNLTILSLLALLVGGYLVFQALDGVVIRRREETAIFRALGVSGQAIMRAFLLEAAVLGACAGVVGIGLGWAGAQVALRGVTATVSALYGATKADHAEIDLPEMLVGLMLSTLCSLVAAWFPARDAAYSPPAPSLGRHATPWRGGGIWRSNLAGCILVIVALYLAQIPPLEIDGSKFPLGAYAAALFWLVGMGLLSGLLLKVAPTNINNPTQTVAFSRLRSASVRHRFATAALTSSVAMTAGMAVMIGSFDFTMRRWIERTMKADIYVASLGAQSASSKDGIRRSTLTGLQSHPKVAETAALLKTEVVLETGPVGLLGMDTTFNHRHQLFAWIEPPESIWSDGAILNESLATKLNLGKGSVISVPTLVGTKNLEIKGVYADYGNEKGSIVLPAETFESWFGAEHIWRIALMVKPSTDVGALRDELAKQHPGLAVRTQGFLKQEALRIFRQTFSITYALEVIGIVVAVAGMGLALASLILDRHAEAKVLSSIGFTKSQIVKTTTTEGLGITLSGIIAGVVAGLWLGWLLVVKVNKQSFGWTLSFHLPWFDFAMLAGGVVVAGILVSRWVSCRVLMGAIVLLALPIQAFEIARPGKSFSFPTDHGSHPEFRTEWWYVTGHLDVDGQHHYSFQATFFRQAGQQETLHLAHSALLNVKTGSFIHEERLNREGWDATSSTGRLEVFNGNWSLTMKGDELSLTFTVKADASLQLKLKPAKPLVVFGDNGVSRKGASEQAASHYLTFTQLECAGEVNVNGLSQKVSGQAWMDHEFSSSQLDRGQVGWDWASLQLNDGTEIMVYRMRRNDGTSDPAGTTLAFIDLKGRVQHTNKFEWEPAGAWQSPHSGASYPIRPTIKVDGREYRLLPKSNDQEHLGKISKLPYWEGACDVLDANGRKIGRAFLELAGYAGDLGKHLIRH
ncbi:MAG: FtsX-like permease family protein [Verrucomicrobiaceae bacterium]|nr:FtsX-like permease family protein [Verrucomicrobiaceae bacterium]